MKPARIHISKNLYLLFKLDFEKIFFTADTLICHRCI